MTRPLLHDREGSPLQAPRLARFLGYGDMRMRAAHVGEASCVDLGGYGFLRDAGLSSRSLSAALERAARLDVDAHRVLLAEGIVTAQVYVEALAAAIDTPVLRLGQLPLGPAELVDGTALPPGSIRELVRQQQAQGRTVLLATPDAIDSLEVKEVRGARLRNAVRGLRSLDPDLSAAGPIRLWQLVVIAALIGLVIGAAVVAPAATRLALMVCVGIPFFVVVALRVAVLLLLLSDRLRRRRRSGERRVRLGDGELPAYSVLVALYKEVAVLPDLVEALSRLDYPAAKLDCMLVLEASDHDTIAAARAQVMPPFMRIVVVPDCTPRTKPKALNYALQLARGDLVVVYDAEDLPDRQQLRKAVHAFEEGGPGVVCVQAQLVITMPPTAG